jgi:hypothetical protein
LGFLFDRDQYFGLAVEKKSKGKLERKECKCFSRIAHNLPYDKLVGTKSQKGGNYAFDKPTFTASLESW